MTSLQLKVLEAFRAIDVPEDKAARAAAAFSSAYLQFEADCGTNLHRRDTDIGKDSADIRKNVSEGRKDIVAVREDITGLKLELAGVKGEMVLHRWMLGFVLATNVAIVFKLFSH